MVKYEIPIRYGEDPQPIDVKVRLTFKGRDADEPIEVQSIEGDETGLLKFTKDEEQSTTEIAVYKSELGDRMLEDNATFWQYAMQPIGFTVTAKPAKGSSQAGSDQSIVIKDSVTLALPPHEIKWSDMRILPAPENPPVIDLYADGKDEFQLRNVLETWLPTSPKGPPTAFSTPYWDASTKRGYDPEVVSFSHWTGPRFDPGIFGPHDDDKPWDVAQPGSGNNRELNRWQSKKALPSKQFPKHTLPFTDWVRVKAWGVDRISGRRINALDLRGDEGFLLTQHVEVRLRPPPIRTEILRPGRPVPADGQPHELELQFIDTKTNEPVKEGEITWELETGGGFPGGSVEPDGVELTEGDGGRTTLNWSPPDLEYRPGARYDQTLKIYRGRGENRLTESPITLWCNPALDLTVSGDKVGTHWRSYDHALVAAGESPAAISVHLGARFNDLWKRLPVEADAFEAMPDIMVTSGGNKVSVAAEERTDDQGRVEIELPEIAKAWQARTDGGETRPLLTLQKWTEEPGSIEDICAANTLGRLVGVTRGKGAPALRRMVEAPTWSSIHESGQVQATHLAEWPAADSCDEAKAIHGTKVLTAALQGAVVVDAVQEKLVDRGIESFGSAAWSFLDFIISKVKWAKALEKIPGIGPHLKRAWYFAYRNFMEISRNLIDRLAHELRRQILPILGKAADGVVGNVFKWIAQTLDDILLGGANTTALTEVSLKNQLREVLAGLSDSVDGTVAHTVGAVSSGSFANDQGRLATYLAQIEALEKYGEKPALGFNLVALQSYLKAFGDAMSNMFLAGLGLIVIGGAASLTVAGAPAGVAAIGIGVSMMSTSAATGTAVAVAGAFIHTSAMVSLFGIAAQVGEIYERITREMVGSGP
ncbi:MAG: hypothetical protein GY925_17575 [Actinomycetia bacterium]|nr:hypothetical protein [Actinomycetes bacterium]